MKVTIEFDNEEDAVTALNGWKLRAAMDEIGNDVFRPARKHGYADEKINEIIAHLEALCEENKSPEELSAVHLISLLERKFYSIIEGLV